MGFFTGLILFLHLFGSCFEASGITFKLILFDCGVDFGLHADKKNPTQ